MIHDESFTFASKGQSHESQKHRLRWSLHSLHSCERWLLVDVVAFYLHLHLTATILLLTRLMGQYCFAR